MSDIIFSELFSRGVLIFAHRLCIFSIRPPFFNPQSAIQNLQLLSSLPFVGNHSDLCSMARYLLVDISNSFTKLVFSDGKRLGEPMRVATSDFSISAARNVIGRQALDGVVLSSVVPRRNYVMFRAAGAKVPVLELGPTLDLGIKIHYPKPRQIGADRLANAVACSALYGAPAIVVDFGTAVTFDVIDDSPAYMGGVIAPGLNAMTSYLHEKTALLPKIEVREPKRAVGKSTKEAMLVGAVYGYRGLIKEIVSAISKEAFGRKRFKLVATGGDAKLIASGLSCFDAVNPNLTLHGLRLVAERHFSGAKSR